MAKTSKWSNVSVNMQSALGTLTSITGITNASPAVITSVAHGLSNGEFILLKSVGITELNDRIFRLVNVSSDTAELEGIDSTNFGTFISGSFEVVTFGQPISTITSVDSSGGDFEFIDNTTIHQNIKTQLPGLPNALTFSFENLWDVADTGLLAMKLANDEQTERAFLFGFTDGQKLAFYGYVGASLVPGGSAQDKVTTNSTITSSSTPTYYNS